MVRTHIVKHRRCAYVVRVGILWKLLVVLPLVFLVCRDDDVRQFRDCSRYDFRLVKVGDERGWNDCAILVGYLRIATKRRTSLGVFQRAGKDSQAGRKQKELDRVGVIKADDFGKNGERGIVNHDFALAIKLVNVVAARIERALKVLALDSVGVGHPVCDRVVDEFRREAVVRGLFRFELVHELLVFLGTPAHSVALGLVHVKKVGAILGLGVKVKPGQRDVKGLLLQVRDHGFQSGIVPFSGDLVQRHVQRLFLVDRKIHEDAFGLGLAHCFEYVQPLVAADDRVARPGVDDDRLDVAEGLDAPFELLELLVARFQFLAWVVGRRVEVGQRHALDIHFHSRFLASVKHFVS